MSKMSDYVSWTRVEPDHKATDPRSGARVPIADPFWSLGRQWWIGELKGFDGGSPVASRVKVSIISLGEMGIEARHQVLSAKLAAPVPRPHERSLGDWRTAYRLGRSAAANLSKRAAATLATIFPLKIPELLTARIPVEHRVDGVALLLAIREREASVADLVGPLAVWVQSHSDVTVGEDLDGFAVETGRHTVDIQAEGVQIRSTTAKGPSLHWSDVTIDVEPIDAITVQQPVPVQLFFEGAPSIRWWGIEEPAVDYSSAPAGPSDLGQLLISASLQEQGGVYWQLPLDVPGNSLLKVIEVQLQDGFGEWRTSEPLEGGALCGWKLGKQMELRPDPVTNWMLILNEPEPLRGDALEEVGLVADEVDNLIWLIEDISIGLWGRGVQLPHLTRRPDPEQEEYYARIAPPETWIAYQQSSPSQLERAILLPRSVQPTPHTRFALPSLAMTPGMLGAGGHRLRRQWSLARSTSGRRVLWQSRRSLADLPRGGSGLLHDQIVRPEV